MQDELLLYPKYIKVVKEWMMETFNGKIFVLSGPTGCGKHSLVNAIANEASFGIKLIVWKDENAVLNNVNEEKRFYMSRVQSLKRFLFRAAAFCATADKKLKRIILIDNFYFHEASVNELQKIFEEYVVFANAIPIVFLLTSAEKPDLSIFETIQSSIKLLCMQPVNSGLCKKIVQTISGREKIKISSDQADEIVAVANGDIRLMLTTLQFCVSSTEKVDIKQSSDLSIIIFALHFHVEKKGKLHNRLIRSLNNLDLNEFCKDKTYSLFHAAGKILAHCV